MESHTTKMTTRGRVAIPKEIRERHGWSAGQAFAVEDHEDGILLRAVEPAGRTELKDLLGIAGYLGPRMSLEQMEEGIGRGVGAADPDPPIR